MMSNKLILIALILFGSSSVDSLELNDICNYNVIEYNGLAVNSFYTTLQHVSLNLNELLSMFIND